MGSASAALVRSGETREGLTVTIKLFAFIRRVPGVPIDEFHDYWREVHGPRIRDTPERARHVLRYEQNHRLAADYERSRHEAEVVTDDFDGVAVQWFDSPEVFAAFASEPTAAIGHDEDARYLDASATTWMLTRDADVIVDKPGGRDRAGVKLVCMVGRNPALDLATFHHHWLENHGGLFQRLPDLNEPLLAYDQNHRIDADYARGGEYDGVTEQWLASLDAWVDSLGAPSHAAEVEPDVAYMLDPARIHFILSGPPHVIIG